MYTDPLGLDVLGTIGSCASGVGNFAAGALDDLTFGAFGAAQSGLGFQQNQGGAYQAGALAMAAATWQKSIGKKIVGAAGKNLANAGRTGLSGPDLLKVQQFKQNPGKYLDDFHKYKQKGGVTPGGKGNRNPNGTDEDIS